MFKPQYKLTVSLVKNINAIERTYGQLEGMKAPQSLLLNLERDNLIRSSHASNSIEGNPLSLPEVTNLLLSDRTPVNRDEKEVKNYFEILKSLDSEVGAPFNLRLVLKIHEKLMKEHGRYDRFDELMSEYSMNIRSLNITGVIVTICNFKEDVISRGLQNFMPIFHALEKRVMHIALEIARSGGGAR